jgi:hypothetical protein
MGDPNPYYNDPAFAAIASNLSRAFIDKNPGQTMVNREHANVYRLQGSKLQRESEKRSAIANTFRNLKGRAPTPEEVASLAADGIEGDMKPGDLGGYTLYHASNSGQDDSAIARAFVGSGKGLSKGEAVSMGDREGIRTKDASNDKARSDSSAGIAASASRANNADSIRAQNERHGKDIEFKERTRFDAPVDYGPGHGKSFNPDDTRAPKQYQPGDVIVPIPAKPTADRFVQSEDPNNPGKNVWTQATEGAPGPARPATERYVPSTDANGVTTYEPARPGLPVAAPKAPVDPIARAKDIHDIELQSLSDIGAVDVNDNGQPLAVNPEFRKMYGAKMEGAKMAAAAEFQATRDAARASAAYRQYLGIQPGSTFKQGGWFRDSQVIPPNGSPAPASGNPAAAATVSGAVPPPAARKPGATYQTPKGPMTWTGTGWLPAQQ